jgi:hypothetical protein
MFLLAAWPAVSRTSSSRAILRDGLPRPLSLQPFAHAGGVGPQRYVMQRHIERAKTLLQRLIGGCGRAAMSCESRGRVGRHTASPGPPNPVPAPRNHRATKGQRSTSPPALSGRSGVLTPHCGGPGDAMTVWRRRHRTASRRTIRSSPDPAVLTGRPRHRVCARFRPFGWPTGERVKSNLSGPSAVAAGTALAAPL